MAHRHKVHARKRADGGETEHEGHPHETGGNPAIFKLAKEHTSIGKVAGDGSKEHMGRRRGGKVGGRTAPYTHATRAMNPRASIASITVQKPKRSTFPTDTTRTNGVGGLLAPIAYRKGSTHGYAH